MIREAARAVATHRVFAVLFAAGLALRVLVEVAYRPIFIYVDSVTVYLNHLPGSPLAWSDHATPDPVGYDLWLLQPVLALSNLAVLAVVQHLLGLAMAVVIYVVLVRRGAWRWLAALAAAPVLLDAYQLQIEHNVMSDTLFQALIVGAFAALSWRPRPSGPALIAAGLLLGAATTVRLVGAPLLVLLLAYALWTRHRPRARIAAAGIAAAAALVPFAAYQLYETALPGQFGAADTRANTLYARVATFVDCTTLQLPLSERPLCPLEPLHARRSPDFYAHDFASPLFHTHVPDGMTLSALAEDFSFRAIRAQPLGLVKAIAVDASRAFTWNHDNLANPDAPTERWRFQALFPRYPTAVTDATLDRVFAVYGGGSATSIPLPAALLREYQLSFGFMPGPVTLLCLLLAFAVVCGARRPTANGKAPPQVRVLRRMSLLWLGAAVLVLGVADAYEFTWRYQLPGLVLVPVAGVLAFTALRWKPRPVPFPHPDDMAAMDDFHHRYGEPALPDVAVVIAAYLEEEGIGRVLAALPDKTGGSVPLPVAAIVVVDGPGDATAEVARAHGAYVAELPRNRGQGAALRLGYALARRGGARWIVTTDADGQYDVAALDSLLAPLREGRADFVTGSRRLGIDESTDHVRRAGVRFFAVLVRLLTGFRATDTSFGMRAMRAEVTAAVTLDQPQYQSSELLIALIMRGFRVTEIPATMHPRGNGKSKKGRNLVYGSRYARVVFSTWWRERRASRWVNTSRSSTRNLITNISPNAPK